MRTEILRLPLISTLILSVLLAACGEGGGKGKTQVAVRVNDEEITVHQLNQALAIMGVAAGNNPAEANKKAMEGLINQTIGVQAALKMKLDRDPAIMQAIESARRRVLLDAYIERGLQKITPPTAAEIQEYFSQHPELFSNRRIYSFNQLTVKADKENISSLKNKVGSVKKLGEFASWLKEKGINYNLASDVKPSEQLPMGMLTHMQKLQAGGLGYLSTPNGVVLIEIVQIIEQPLSEQQAQPLIANYLANQKKMAAAQEMLQEMRASAKVEYMGEFKSDALPDAKPEQSAATQAATQPPQVAPKQLQPANTNNGYIEKGLKGL